jgi:biopolymer transport protein ExbD
MAPVEIAAHKPKAGVRRIIKSNPKIDMTPMVDLGFLLIAFFIMTTELSKPTVMNLYVPHEGIPTPVPESHSITLLTSSEDKVFYYYGQDDDAIKHNQVFLTSYDGKKGIRKIIGEKQLQLDRLPGGRKELVVLIKPGKESSYKNVVDILDEMAICGVSRFALIKPGKMDIQYLEKNW